MEGVLGTSGGQTREHNICYVPKHYESFKSACTPQHDIKYNRKSQLPTSFYKKCTCNEEHIVCREVNSLLLLYVQKDISLDYADIGNDCARRNPRTTYNCFIILM